MSTAEITKPILHDALTYASLGLAVGPWVLSSDGRKIPLGLIGTGNKGAGSGFTDWSNDPKTVRQLFNGRDRYDGVGCVPGSAGFVVVDVDVKNGAKGEESLRTLVADYGDDFAELTDTLVTETPSGGWHLWFKAGEVVTGQDNGGAVCADGEVVKGSGVDVRQGSGFVPLPPILGPDTGYNCTSDVPFHEAIKTDMVISAPEWFARAWPPKAAKSRDGSALADKWNTTVKDFLAKNNAGRFTDDELKRTYDEDIEKLRTSTNGRHDLALKITGRLAHHCGRRDVDAEDVLKRTLAALSESRAGEGRDCVTELVELFTDCVVKDAAGRAVDKYLDDLPTKADRAETTDTESAEPGRPFGLMTAGEIGAEVDAMPPAQWLWRRVWPADGYGVLSASWKVGKTFMQISAAVSAASGTPWLSLFEAQRTGTVVVFAGEGGKRKLTRRGRAVAAHHGVDWDTLPIYLAERVPKMGDAHQVELLAKVVAELKPVLVIIDPLYLAVGGDADSSKLYSMGERLAPAQRACQESGAALMLVHHNKRDKSAKGSEAMSGAGPAEWGRVLITAELKSSSVDIETQRTDVHIALTLEGDELAGGEYRFRRRVWVDDPDDLASPMHYQVEAIANDVGVSSDGLKVSQRRVLDALTALGDWRTKHEIGDYLANDGQGPPLKHRTILEACAELVDLSRIESHQDGAGTARSWRIPPKDALCDLF